MNKCEKCGIRDNQKKVRKIMNKCGECGIGDIAHWVGDEGGSCDVCKKCYLDWVIEMELEMLEW